MSAHHSFETHIRCRRTQQMNGIICPKPNTHSHIYKSIYWFLNKEIKQEKTPLYDARMQNLID